MIIQEKETFSYLLKLIYFFSNFHKCALAIGSTIYCLLIESPVLQWEKNKNNCLLISQKNLINEKKLSVNVPENRKITKGSDLKNRKIFVLKKKAFHNNHDLNYGHNV